MTCMLDSLATQNAKDSLTRQTRQSVRSVKI